MKGTKILDRYRDITQLAGYQTYKGLRIHALPGLHEFIETKFSSIATPPASVLELGAGSGALSFRCLERGFQVVAVDLVPENFQLHDLIEFVECDLNDDFSTRIARRFDVILAIEIVEHLENPRHFLREVRLLLKSPGFVLLTTPNIENPLSKAMFVRDGLFQWFTDRNYRSEGHITPISRWYLNKALNEADLHLIEITSYGNVLNSIRGWWRMKLLAWLIKKLSHHECNGEILCIIASTKEADCIEIAKTLG